MSNPQRSVSGLPGSDGRCLRARSRIRQGRNRSGLPTWQKLCSTGRRSRRRRSDRKIKNRAMDKARAGSSRHLLADLQTRSCLRAGLARSMQVQPSSSCHKAVYEKLLNYPGEKRFAHIRIYTIVSLLILSSFNIISNKSLKFRFKIPLVLRPGIRPVFVLLTAGMIIFFLNVRIAGKLLSLTNKSSQE